MDTTSREFWALNCTKTGAELSRMYGLHPSRWRARKAKARVEYPDLPWVRFGVKAAPEDETAKTARITALEAELAKALTLSGPEKMERDREILRLRAELSSLKARYDEALVDRTIEESLLRAFERRVTTLTPCDAPLWSGTDERSTETAVALMSDFHIGEKVSGEETGGLAWYDFRTFVTRYQHYIDTLLNITFGKLTGYDFRRLEVFMIGDMVSGVIHEELVETSDETLMEWLLDGATVVAQGIRELAARFPEVHLTCVIGNHGRVTKKPRFKKRYVNYDYLFYRILQLELAAQSNVTFDIPKSFWTLRRVEGHDFLLLHGDQIKSWNGIPWYGIERALQRLTTLLAAQRKFFDYAVLGHFHSGGALDRVNGELILNGSMPGGNEFSIGALFASNKPMQFVFGVHPEHGKTWSYGIDLSSPPDEIRYTW